MNYTLVKTIHLIIIYSSILALFSSIIVNSQPPNDYENNTSSPTTRSTLFTKKHRVYHRNTKRNLNEKQQNVETNDFNKPTRNVTAKVGETVILTCVISSSYGVNPGVIWMQGKLGNVLTLNINRITVDPRFDIIQQPLSHQTQSMHPDEGLDQINQETNQVIGKQQFQNEAVTYYNLRIENVQLYDENEYACETSITKRNEDQPNLHSLIQLHVTQSPSFIESLTSESNLAVLEYGEAILKCFASGKPTPRIRWYQVDDSTGQIRDLSHESTSLTIKNISKEDNIKYECVASNGILPSVSKKFTLTVYYSPIINVIQPHTNQNTAHTVILGCIVNSNPESTLTWFRLENQTQVIIEQSNSKYHIHKIRQSNQTVSYFKVKNIEKSDYVKYKCVATNTAGRSEATIEIMEIQQDSLRNRNKPGKIHKQAKNQIGEENDDSNYGGEQDLENDLNSNQNENEYAIKPKFANSNSRKIGTISKSSKHSFSNDSTNKSLIKYHINKSNRLFESENSLKRVNDLMENNANKSIAHVSLFSSILLVLFFNLLN